MVGAADVIIRTVRTDNHNIKPSETNSIIRLNMIMVCKNRFSSLEIVVTINVHIAQEVLTITSMHCILTACSCWRCSATLPPLL